MSKPTALLRRVGTTYSPSETILADAVKDLPPGTSALRMVVSAGHSPAGAATIRQCTDKLLEAVASVSGCDRASAIVLPPPAGVSVTAETPSRFVAVWILRQWVHTLAGKAVEGGWLGGCSITIFHTSDTCEPPDLRAEELHRHVAPDEVMVTGSVAVVATHLMNGCFEVQPVDAQDLSSGVYRIIERSENSRPISDVGWAVRAIQSSELIRNEGIDKAHSWIDNRQRPWSMVVNTSTPEGATLAAARLALALHGDDRPIVYTRANDGCCPISTMVAGRVARSDNPTAQADRWANLQLDADRAMRPSELSLDRSAAIHAGAKFLGQTVGDHRAVLVLDGIGLDGIGGVSSHRAELEWLLERLSSSDISVLVATHGQNAAVAELFGNAVDVCFTGMPDGFS